MVSFDGSYIYEGNVILEAKRMTITLALVLSSGKIKFLQQQ